MAMIYAVAKTDGMITLREMAMQMLMEGKTTFSEIVAATG